MADIQVDDGAFGTLFAVTTGRTLVWTSKTTGYEFFFDGALDFHWRKTIDSGSTWVAEGTIRSGSLQKFAVWYDKWTNGDTGGIIHLCFVDGDDDNITYNSLDTSDDSLGGEVTVLSGVSASTTGDFTGNCLAIVKSRGGNIYVGGWLDNDGGEKGFWRATDSPATSFVARADVTDGNVVDLIIFDPGAEADSNDIWCFYWDVSASEISLKIYDDSENSWGETSISLNMAAQANYFQMDSCHRHSDNHSILVAWDGLGTAGNAKNLKVWDIGGSGSITAKTNVITNTAEYAQVGIMINQQNNDLYVSYCGGADFTSNVTARYQLSQDGGATWGGDTIFSENGEDDQRHITGGTSVGNDGGRWMPIWFNDDLNDLLTNLNNSIEIAAAAGPANLKSVNAVITANIKSINDVLITNVKSINAIA